MAESLSLEGGLELQRGPLGRVLYLACQAFALAGGVVLLALINMSLVSIIGRKLFNTPIRGDIELMEIGASIAIAAFLPLCEVRATHIKVDTFTMKLPAGAQRLLDAVAHLLCMSGALILAWRTALQLRDNLEYGDVSTLLSIPMWIPLGLIVPSLILLALASAYRVSVCLSGGRP
ncbi:TRAP transporter small permease [Pseudomonas sp. OF001]|mgnify:CR=1 FL=1|uniref:TRAP transporter small permease n=1 Tax=unclassified Pseudomonas TaxID=196821 RepID=UPI00191A1220|nr:MULTISPECIES: TRAP transporter small permease [unclassified Pseudomonas]WPP44958.1 TRAP transporter small permease [Pseudomonas sp. AN-1]CAD5376606.1 TRAP transporter small permease [Pseudomonas sp. OF001]